MTYREKSSSRTAHNQAYLRLSARKRTHKKPKNLEFSDLRRGFLGLEFPVLFSLANRNRYPPADPVRSVFLPDHRGNWRRSQLVRATFSSARDRSAKQTWE